MASSQASITALDAGNLFNVNGLVAVVTGGGTGIGLMITKALAANGAAKVYILGRRLAKLEEAAAAVGPAVVVPVACDVTSKASLGAAAARVESESGHADLLVCNAGIAGPFGAKAATAATTLETTGTTTAASLDDFVATNLAVGEAEYAKTFAVNVGAVWFTAMSFLRLLAAGNAAAGGRRDAPTSQVVAVSSIAGFNKANTGGWAYGQSKAACTHLVKQLSAVLPQWGIRANAICPGIYPSQMTASLVVGEGGAVGKDVAPLERTGGEQDMAGTILYLASKAGAYANGAVIVSDGGRLTLFPSTF